MKMNELYWAAGFIEGEGSFRKSSLRQSVAVSVAQVQREPLERLMNLFGGQIHGKNSQKYNANASPCSEWNIGGARAVGVVMTLYPLMSTKRKSQIRESLHYWRNSLPHTQHRTHCQRGHAFTDENTTYRKSATRNGRECRMCQRIRNAAHKRKTITDDGTV